MSYTQAYTRLAEFGRKVLEIEVLDETLPFIAKYAKDAISADRCSIFVYDADKHPLWTTLADNVDRIIISAEQGIAGHSLATKKSIVENHPYENAYFHKEIDKQTGYLTKNLIVTPILGSQKEVIGILQLLNKEGGFDKDDAKFMKFFTHYISGFLELATLNEQYDETRTRI